MLNLIIITPISKPTNVPAIYHSIESASKLAMTGASVQITWFPVFTRKCETQGEDWKVRFSRSRNENLLITCKISTSDNINVIRNEVLEELQSTSEYNDLGESFITFLSDNSIFYDSLMVSLQMTDKLQEKWDGFIYNRKPHGDISITDIDKNVLFNQLVAAQICFKLKLLCGIRFDDYSLYADSIFIDRIYKKNKDVIDINEAELCYHNYLS